MRPERAVRSPLAIALSMLLMGCHEQASQISHAQLQELSEGNPGMTKACVEKVRKFGLAVWPLPTEECFQMDEPRRWRGLWGREFELSRFCQEPATECTHYSAGVPIWLSASGAPKWAANPALDQDSPYAVDFIGRMTAIRGYHGHQGAYPYEIVVDRMISIQRVPDEARKK